MVDNISQIVLKLWKNSAVLSVHEISRESGEYKVTENFRVNEAATEPFSDDLPETNTDGMLSMNQNTNMLKHNIVNAQMKTCTCGKFQEMMYPCRHAMAYYRKWEKVSLRQIVDNHVHGYYKFGTHQSMYTFNMYPVISDNIQYDGTTKPPPIPKRGAGRPTKLRTEWRERSKFDDPSESTLTCGNCGQNGHNRRTCERRRMKADAILASQNGGNGGEISDGSADDVAVNEEVGKNGNHEEDLEETDEEEDEEDDGDESSDSERMEEDNVTDLEEECD
jgi:hypothetical protein